MGRINQTFETQRKYRPRAPFCGDAPKRFCFVGLLVSTKFCDLSGAPRPGIADLIPLVRTLAIVSPGILASYGDLK